jgi:hypothetical protein
LVETWEKEEVTSQVKKEWDWRVNSTYPRNLHCRLYLDINALPPYAWKPPETMYNDHSRAKSPNRLKHIGLKYFYFELEQRKASENQNLFYVNLLYCFLLVYFGFLFILGG